MNAIKSDKVTSVENLSSPTPPADTKKNDDETLFNPRYLWPDIIKCPKNEWVFECSDIVNRLGMDKEASLLTKKKMEKCLMYFHRMRKDMKLFDHTYTASCILFYRYWYKYELPRTLPECIHLAQAILVTACKTMENNRPTDHFIKATCDFMLKDNSSGTVQKLNIEKLKWEVRDQLVAYEKKVLCQLGFDLNLQNPKELIEEIFSGYYRYSRDSDMDDNFKSVFPVILQESRNFIIQTGTQPISLLCDGYTLVAVAMIFSSVMFFRMKGEPIRFPRNFFRKRFPIDVTPEKVQKVLSDYQVLEKEFFDLKSNKGEQLSISSDEISKLIDEDEGKDEIINPYDYEYLQEGNVSEELLKYTEKKIEELTNRIISESAMKRPNDSISDNPLKKQKI